ncbi:MAG: hypothetical protein OEL76_18360, partial [Siculibacillus sp.]|nr:hypothetical protein [Siculibacillus sp.]
FYADPATPASPAAVAATTLQPIGSRPSRLMTAAATGAPEMPLPMVDGGTVVQPSRIAAAMSAITETPGSVTGSVAPGATRVRTVTIAPVSASSTAAATTATSSAGRPLLPPVPGETADPAAPAVPRIATTSNRSTSRDMRPLDLLGFRRIGAGRV